MPNRRSTPSPSLILTILQNLRRQRPSLLERKIISDRRIIRRNLYRAVAAFVVHGVRWLRWYLWVPALLEILHETVVWEATEIVEGGAAAVNVGCLALWMMLETHDGAYRGRWSWWRGGAVKIGYGCLRDGD